MANENTTTAFIHKFRTGIMMSIALLAGLSGAGIENSIIFAAGVVSAVAFGIYLVAQQLMHKQFIIATFIATTLGALLPVFSFAFMMTKAALAASASLALFLLFIGSSTEIEKKTFKDGFKAIATVIVMMVVTFIVGVLIKPIL